jgi:phosphate transport system substrate-binding protein
MTDDNRNSSTIPCPYCKYEANSINATNCRICNTPLNSEPKAQAKAEINPKHQLDSSQSNPNRQSFKGLTFLWLLPIILFSIIIGRSIILYQNRDIVTVRPQETEETKEKSQNIAPQLKLYSTLEQVENVPQGLFWYGSSPTFSPLHTQTKTLTQAQPGFQIQYKEPPVYTKPGSTIGINMLLDGLVSFTELSRPIQDSEYAQAKQRGIQLQQIPIASDGIVFYVHPSLPIEKLSTNQIRDLILGKITNWKQLNGPNLPVKPFVFDPQISSSTLLLLFEESELTQFGKSTKFVRDYTDAIRKVSRTPGSFSYASASTMVNQRSVRPLLLARGSSQAYVNPFTKERKINSKAFKDGSYPLVRRLFIVIRQDGTIDEVAGLAYANLLLSKQGQKLIEEVAFVPIR